MLSRELVIGHRIVDVRGDSTLSTDDFNFLSFLYILDNHMAFAMPCGDECDDLLPQAIVTPSYQRLDWPEDEANHFQANLWDATIVDILVPQDREERYPDTGVIKLSSGWYVTQLGGAPIGIAPAVYLQPELPSSEPMVSVWNAAGSTESPAAGR